jgi:hypothetical protein
MSSTTLSHGSYGIGIICALVEEKAAMEMMLDEEHVELASTTWSSLAFLAVIKAKRLPQRSLYT